MKYIAISLILALSACSTTSPAQVVKKGNKVFTKQNPYGVDVNSDPKTVSVTGQSASKTILKEDGYLVSKETRITETKIEEDEYLKKVQSQHADLPQQHRDDSKSKLKPLDRQVVNNDGSTSVEKAEQTTTSQSKGLNPDNQAEQVSSAPEGREPDPAFSEANDLSDLTANIKDPKASESAASLGAGGGYLLSSPRGLSNYKWPLDGEVISRFGKNGNKTNDGINIAAPLGTKVAAAAKGKVIYVGNSVEGYGNLVIVKHEGDMMTAYSHLKEINVARGANVNLGDKIGSVGQSGNVETPQLHFSMRVGKKTVNPETAQ